MASATAYQRGREVLICAYHRSRDGPRVAGFPVVILDVDASDADLGAAVLLALRSSPALPPPSRWRSGHVLRAAGARSYGAFVRGTEAAAIAADGDDVTVTPLRNLGPRQGFDYRLDRAVTLSRPDAAAVGSAVRAALPRAADADAEPEDAEGPLVRDALRAAEWIAEALTTSGYTADFTVGSLAEVDRFFEDQLRRAGRPRRGGLLAEDLEVRLFALGAYVGEVARRSTGGAWDPRGLSDGDEHELRLRLGDGTVVWPMQRVAKRFQRGGDESVAAWGAALGLEGP